MRVAVLLIDSKLLLGRQVTVKRSAVVIVTTREREKEEEVRRGGRIRYRQLIQDGPRSLGRLKVCENLQKPKVEQKALKALRGFIRVRAETNADRERANSGRRAAFQMFVRGGNFSSPCWKKLRESRA